MLRWNNVENNFIYNIFVKRKKGEEQQDGTNLIDIGDADLKELCSDEDHSDAELEMDHFTHLKNFFTKTKKTNSNSPGYSCGKTAGVIGGKKKTHKNKIK